jgi:hypothetical protein
VSDSYDIYSTKRVKDRRIFSTRYKRLLGHSRNVEDQVIQWERSRRVPSGGLWEAYHYLALGAGHRALTSTMGSITAHGGTVVLVSTKTIKLVEW